MIIDFVTLFPDMIKPIINESIIGRAIKGKKVFVNIINLRDYSKDKHYKVDDTSYGGGAGMLLTCQPVFDCIKDLRKKGSKVILMTPQGQIYTQKKANELSSYSHLIIICGHYEGFDDRIRSIIDMEISIGDYVLTGGEIPALAIVDSVVRLIDGVIDSSSHEFDSFSNWMIEHPQFTKPRVYEGLEVPSVLLSGDHIKIEEYRKRESIKRTILRRPDLIDTEIMSDKDIKIMLEIKKELKEK